LPVLPLAAGRISKLERRLLVGSLFLYVFLLPFEVLVSREILLCFLLFASHFQEVFSHILCVINP